MTMEASMSVLVDAVARHNVSNADRLSAIVDGGRALLDIQAKLEHGEFGGDARARGPAPHDRLPLDQGGQDRPRR